MSNKFKFLTGALVLAFALLVGVKSASAAYTQTMSLQMGMNNSQVTALQQTLNMTSCKVATSGVGSPGLEGTYFGPETKAAVECFQAANGIPAIGIVGPLTGAKLAQVSMSMPVTGMYPAGCSSSAGYSSTTGASCATTVSTGLPAGCLSSTGYSTTTGAPCSGTPMTTTYPSGCVSWSGYSSTTGMACSSSSTTVSSTGPFSINSVQPLSGYYNTQVGVGATNKVVGDMRIVTGAGGSGNLTGVNLAFYNRGNGNYQFPVYAQSVSVLLNGAVVGTLPATSFTSYNSQYSAYIPTSGAVLNPNTTNDLQIAITALPVIDSANLTTAANQWAFELTTLRYQDTTGSFSYSVPSSDNFDYGTITGTENTPALQSSIQFASASTASSITLTVTKDENDYNNHVASASTSSPTQNQSLAILDLAAQGAPVTINRLPVTIVVTNSGTGGVDASDLVNTLALYKGNSATGQALDSEATNGASAVGTECTSTTTTSTCVVTFQNLNLTIPAGSTQIVTVAGNISPIDGTVVTAGATAQVSVTSTNVNNIQAYDQYNNILNNNTSNILIGSTTGSIITFYVNGIQVASSGTATATATSPGGTQSHSTIGMTIPFSVTAFGEPAYIPHVATPATSASAGANIQFCVDTASGACQAVGTGVITYAGSNGLVPDGNGNYQVSAGQTQNFILQITYTANGSASYRGSLLNVNWNNTDSSSVYSTYTAGLDQGAFQTNYVVGS